MTAGRKRNAVLRILRSEPLETVARKLSVTAADLSAWRDAFLEAGAASRDAGTRVNLLHTVSATQKAYPAGKRTLGQTLPVNSGSNTLVMMTS